MNCLATKLKVGQIGAFDHYGQAPFELESSNLDYFSYYLILQIDCEYSLYPPNTDIKNIWYDVIDLSTGQRRNFGDKYFESHFTLIS